MAGPLFVDTISQGPSILIVFDGQVDGFAVLRAKVSPRNLKIRN